MLDVRPAEPVRGPVGRAARVCREEFQHFRSGEGAPIGLVNRTLGPGDVLLATRLLRAGPDTWASPEPVHRFEAEFARWNGSTHATAWASARVALSAALQALDLRPGDDVLVPGFTCVVVANALRYAGLNPIYVDIELETYGADRRSIEQRATPSTRAMIVQHLFGLVARDYQWTLDYCRDRGIKVVDDCSHATGATYLGQRIGNLAVVAVYSSEQSKVLSTIQGGVAATNDPRVAERLSRQWQAAQPSGRDFTRRLLRNVQLGYWEAASPLRRRAGRLANRRVGEDRLVSTPDSEINGQRPEHYGRRMAGPVARLASQQLRKLDRLNSERRKGAQRWVDWARDRGYCLPSVVPNSEPVFLRYPLLVPASMKADTGWGKELGVAVGVWFTSQLHPRPGVVDGCPNAQHAVQHCVNLPTL